MQDAYREGKVRAIGVSNFYPDHFIDLAENMDIVPAVNQVETHVFCQQQEATHIERMKENLDIFDFALSDDDMATIATLDTGRSLFFDHHSAEAARMFMGWR